MLEESCPKGGILVTIDGVDVSEYSMQAALERGYTQEGHGVFASHFEAWILVDGPQRMLRGRAFMLRQIRAKMCPS